MTAPVHPVKVLPRLDAKPWGGRRLEAWGIALPPHETIGEALLTAPEAVVVSAEPAGTTLGEIARQAPEVWVGLAGLAVTGGRPLFPLLIKLIEARADLSIQVHPDDRTAAIAGLGTGKTEAYHILEAEPGSLLYLGVRPEATASEFAAACLLANGAAARLLRQIPAEPGMTILIPAGTPHALGAGITLYEIQQPSNVTFRLDDWGRVDAAGVPRPLHQAEGLAVVDPLSRPTPISRVRLTDEPVRREVLVATRYFALERMAFPADTVAEVADVASPQVFTVIAGTAMLRSPGWSSPLAKGETVAVPVDTGLRIEAESGTVVLRGWVPDLEREIVAPARAAGASDEAIRALGIATGAVPDVIS